MRDTLLGRRDLRDLRDQWPAVDYVDRKGKRRTHIFDHCARYDSGLVEAIAVKPFDRVDYSPKDGTPSLREIVQLITEQRTILRFAHKAVILTENDVSDGDAHNARWLRQARRFRVEQDVSEARTALRELGNRFRFHDLVRGAAISWRRFHAVWSLIDDGVLVAEDQEAIIDRSWLRTAQMGEIV